MVWIIAVAVLVVPVWMMRYRAPEPLTVPIAVRHLLSCLALLLLTLVAKRDILLGNLWQWSLVASVLFAVLLVLVVVGEMIVRET